MSEPSERAITLASKIYSSADHAEGARIADAALAELEAEVERLRGVVRGYRIRCKGIPGCEYETDEQADAYASELGRGR